MMTRENPSGRDRSAEKLAWELLNALPVMRRQVLGLDGIKQTQGMPLSHIQLLAMLEEEGSATVSQISRRFGIAKSNITPMVDRLITEGMVERVRSPRDMRVVNIILCPAGRERLKCLHEEAAQNFSEWMKRLDEARAERFVRALKEVCLLAREADSQTNGPEQAE